MPAQHQSYSRSLIDEQVGDSRRSRSAPVTEPSRIAPLHTGRERIKGRFRLLRRLPENHDNDGAKAANRKSVDKAIAFIDSIKEPFPSCFATLDDDGSAVIEFEDNTKGVFADLTFRNEVIECYWNKDGAISKFFEGTFDSPEAHEFIETYMGVVY